MYKTFLTSPLLSPSLLSKLPNPKKIVVIVDLIYLLLKFQKQIATLNELATNLIDHITSAREDWEGEQSAGISCTCFAVDAYSPCDFLVLNIRYYSKNSNGI